MHMLDLQRHFRMIAVAALLAFTVAARRAQADEPLNLLFFGNSFTIGNNVAGKVGYLAAADGHASPLILTDLSGGKDLDYHIGEVVNNPQNNVSNTAIAGKTWDYVVIQGYSTEATHLQSPATDFIPDAQTLYTNVRDHASGRGAGVKAILYETWARGDMVSNGSFATMNAMQAEITSNYYLAAGSINAGEGMGSARVAPVGEAFELMDFDAALYVPTQNKYHPSVNGSLLASMVIYRTIYGEHVSDIKYASASSWAGVNEATWNELAGYADAVTIIPEPASMALLGASGLMAAGYWRR